LFTPRAQLRNRAVRFAGDLKEVHKGWAMDAIEEIRRQAHAAGRAACEAGKPRSSNPHNRPAALPGATGEPFANWQARSDGWFSGWDEAGKVKGDQTRWRPQRRGIPATGPAVPSSSGAPVSPAVLPAVPRQWYVLDKGGVRRLTAFVMTQEEAMHLFPGAEPGPVNHTESAA